MSEVLIQDTSFPARDGYTLAATVFAPAQAPRGAVLINSATAVPRKIYRGFAAYLAEQGQTVLTYDPASPGAMAYREAAAQLATLTTSTTISTDI